MGQIDGKVRVSKQVHSTTVRVRKLLAKKVRV